MRKKYLLLLLVALAMALGGCPCDKKKYVAPPPAPSAPSNLTATAVSSTQIDLSWKDNSTNEKGFYVYGRITGDYARVGILEANAISYNDTGLSPETTYWYKVTAYNDGGESGSSNEVNITTPAGPVPPPPEPGAPFDLTAVVVSSEQIDLTWKETSENEKGFYVYRRNVNSYRKICVVLSDITSYSDSPLSPETTYWYKVTAYGDGGESSSSNEASATTPPEVEMLGYSMRDEEFYDWSQEWSIYIRGAVKNNTSRTLAIWIKGKFFNYDDVMVDEEDTYLHEVDSGKTQEFHMRYIGERIKRVEAWVEDYF